MGGFREPNVSENIISDLRMPRYEEQSERLVSKPRVKFQKRVQFPDGNEIKEIKEFESVKKGNAMNTFRNFQYDLAREEVRNNGRCYEKCKDKNESIFYTKEYALRNWELAYGDQKPRLLENTSIGAKGYEMLTCLQQCYNTFA